LQDHLRVVAAAIACGGRARCAIANIGMTAGCRLPSLCRDLATSDEPEFDEATLGRPRALRNAHALEPAPTPDDPRTAARSPRSQRLADAETRDSADRKPIMARFSAGKLSVAGCRDGLA
jgi:hypothetical protein